MKTRHAFTKENTDYILKREVEKVFSQVLEYTAVYKKKMFFSICINTWGVAKYPYKKSYAEDREDYFQNLVLYCKKADHTTLDGGFCDRSFESWKLRSAGNGRKAVNFITNSATDIWTNTMEKENTTGRMGEFLHR